VQPIRLPETALVHVRIFGAKVLLLALLVTEVAKDDVKT